ncbi:MAG: hypothetical protein JNL98_38840 [Bryobacterales bacterium]|nr:hypothetical protein [Bryobacterales bacterium]
MALKIISWNLKNIGQSKLSNKIDPMLAGAGLGNNALDYMMNVVMGDAIWQNINGTAPVDIFVVIELKSGGTAKGNAVSGTAIPTLNALSNAMNNVANANNITAQYHYSYATPLITGRHECVGVIYNDTRLTPTATGVGRNSANNQFLRPRTPFWVTFSDSVTNGTFNLIGIHAPPPKGSRSSGSFYVDPINFCVQMANVDQINGAGVANASLVGDFNCSPTSSYTKYPPPNYTATAVQPFTGLTNFQGIITNQLTSVRKKVNNVLNPPANYLADSYDNIIYRPNNAGINASGVLDTIGNAPAALYQNNLRRLVSNFWKVSDHLPVMVILN